MVKSLNNDITADALRRRAQRVREEIAAAALAGGHDPARVRLMAVTKYVGAEAAARAVEAGIPLIGENRAQSLAEKYPVLAAAGAEIHFIGRLQRNKAARVARMASTVQSLDSLALAADLDRHAGALGKRLDVYIEVNIGRDPNKAGFDPDAVFEAADALRERRNLTVRGLMTILPLDASEAGSEKYFSQMQGLYVDISAKNRDNVCVDCLSMGMSGDYRLAVKHGSTMVRLGTVLFG